MKRKVKILLVLISFSICLCLMSSTYSRYVASTKGNVDATFSKWQILVANTDITNNSNSVITLEPTIEEQEHVLTNTIAPTSKGYFDISVDPTNVDVSFKYNIDLSIENEEMPDLMITKYAILPQSYIEGDELNIIPLVGSEIANEMIYNNTDEAFKFESFTIRVYFEWYEGENEQMNDEADANVGKLAAQEDKTLKMDANISFEQIID